MIFIFREAVEVNEDWIINKASADATPLASNDASNDEKEMDEESSNIIDIEGDESQLSIMEVVEESNHDHDKHSDSKDNNNHETNDIVKHNDSIEVVPEFIDEIDELDAQEKQSNSETELDNGEPLPKITVEASEYSNKNKEDSIINDNNTDFIEHGDFDFLNSSGESLGLNDENLTESQRQFLAANKDLIQPKEKAIDDSRASEREEKNNEDSDSESERLVIDTI